MKKQKDRARNATANEFGDWIEFHHCDSVEFLGYDFTEIDGARLTRHRTVKQKNKEMIQLVFDRTPFYGEMGGQVGDTGYIESENGERIKILDTVKENNLTIHIAEKLPSDCSGSFRLVVDAARRRNIENNHSCTHLLHQALREILGTHVEQKGSFVTPDYFRFDFSHFEKLTDEQIDKVEKRVNELIRTNFPLVEKRDGTMDDAKAMGAMALFGEKYGDHVRIVRFGDSVELCGGCHTGATGNIGFFKIVSESAIAAGIRRIEARTGLAAENIVDMMENTLRSAKALFNNAPDLALAIKKLIDENDGFKKEIENVAKEKAAAFKQVLLDEAKEINGIRTVILRQADPAMLKNAAFMLQKEAENLAIVAAYETEGKPQLLVMYSADLIAKGHNASNDVRAAAKAILGGGGGQSGLATAGGKNVQGLNEAIEILLNNIK